MGTRDNGQSDADLTDGPGLSGGRVEQLLHREFVRTGRLTPAVAKLFSRLQKFRLDADYAAEFVFSEEGARE